MGFFDRMREPVFFKESSDLEIQMDKLRDLEPLLNQEGRAKLHQEIKCLEYGIAGEKNIAYELKNSHMPMVILHDIYLEDGELNAQIDYLVFTRKLCFVIECKNLFGDIEINNAGDFIRTMEFGGRTKRQGLYSPITQNQHHLQLMKKVLLDREKNIFKRRAKEKYFDNFYKSVVVLANPRTVLNARYAKKEIRDNVIRADQLVSYIKNSYSESEEIENNDSHLKNWAETFLRMHREVEHDYTRKFEPYILEETQEPEEEAEIAVTAEPDPYETSGRDEDIPIEDTAIYRELRGYRLSKSREEKVKAYYIFNNDQLKMLIDRMPLTREQLLQVPGFGEVKVNKYGGDILSIILKYI